MLRPQTDQPGGEFHEPLTGRIQLPVIPGDLVVLAVAVVVATLRAADFIAAADHGNALRQDQRCQKVTRLPLTQIINLSVVGWTFRAHVPAIVVVCAVGVVVAVAFVVLAVVAHQIGEGEAVMRRDEIDGRVGLAAVALVKIARSGDAIGKV